MSPTHCYISLKLILVWILICICQSQTQFVCNDDDTQMAIEQCRERLNGVSVDDLPESEQSEEFCDESNTKGMLCISFLLSCDV